MSFRKFLTSRAFILSLALAIILVVLLIALTLYRLKSYTHHGISYQVPDFTGMTYAQSDSVAKTAHVEVQIMDSVYNKNAEPGAIVDQVPKGNKRVKQGRVIFLTINSLEPEKVKLPKVTDISYRQVQVLLDNCGLNIDSIVYQPSEYNDLVLSVLQNSAEVGEGDKLEKGSSVVLVIGQSKGNVETPLPNLQGLFIDDAKGALNSARLNLGVLIYDASVQTKDDTLNARVWKQMPDAALVQKVYLGSSVDLWLTTDDEKLMQDILP